MKSVIKIIILLVFACNVSSCGSESNMIEGKVFSEQNKPLAGVLVQVVGTDLYAESKSDGSFFINTKERGNELVFNKKGYQLKFYDLKASTDDELIIQLKTE